MLSVVADQASNWIREMEMEEENGEGCLASPEYIASRSPPPFRGSWRSFKPQNSSAGPFTNSSVLVWRLCSLTTPQAGNWDSIETVINDKPSYASLTA